jgi:hypothetical protein
MSITRFKPIKILAAAVLATATGIAAAQTNDLAQEFSEASYTLDLIALQNSNLRTRISLQEELIGEFEEEIQYAAMIANEEDSPLNALIEQMMSGLEQFVESDLPFHMDRRRGQLDLARELVDHPEASIREKFQRMMTLYLAETNYGATLESYEDTLEINGVETEVDVVRVGRIALAFQSKDRVHTGVWDKQAREWTVLEPGDYRTAIQRAINVASGLLASEMIFLPITAPEIVQ